MEFDIRDDVLVKYNGTGEYVTVPNGVRVIEREAFRRCESLRAVTLPASVRTVKTRAFSECTNLESFFAEEGLECIERQVFGHCTSLRSVTLPSTLTAIGGSCFSHCESLSEITLPDGVTELLPLTFLLCKNIKKINASASLRKIGFCVFDDIPYWRELLPDENGFVSFTCCLVRYEGKSERLEIPSRFTNILQGVFRGNTSLRSVVLHGGLRVLESNCFRDCTALEEAVFQDGVPLVSDDTFRGCVSLRSVRLPNTLEWIGTSAFEDCRSLTSVISESKCEYVFPSAFRDCVSLKTASFRFARYIQVRAFSGCEALEDFTAEDGAVEIMENAFLNCRALKRVRLPASLVSVSESAFVSIDGDGVQTPLEIPTVICPKSLRAAREATRFSSEALCRGFLDSPALYESCDTDEYISYIFSHTAVFGEILGGMSSADAAEIIAPFSISKEALLLWASIAEQCGNEELAELLSEETGV